MQRLYLTFRLKLFIFSFLIPVYISIKSCVESQNKKKSDSSGANKQSMCVIMNLNWFKANLLTFTCKRGGSARTLLLTTQSWTLRLTSFMNIYVHILYQSNIIPKVLRRHKTYWRLQNANSFSKSVLFLAAIDTTQLDKSDQVFNLRRGEVYQSASCGFIHLDVDDTH